MTTSGKAMLRQWERVARRLRTDAWMHALGFGEQLIDGRHAVGGLLARVVAGMSAEDFDQWRLGRMLDRNYLRNRFSMGDRRA